MKINSKDLVNDVAGSYEGATTVHWLGVDLIIQKNIPLEDILLFVNAVVENSFQGDDIEYSPELIDYLIKYETVSRYTNLELNGSTQENYDFIYSSGIYETILSHIDISQYNEMVTAIHKKIDYFTMSKELEISKAIQKLEIVMDEFSEITSGIMENPNAENIKSILKKMISND